MIHVSKIGLSGVIVGANSKSIFAPKTGYQPSFPSPKGTDGAPRLAVHFPPRQLSILDQLCNGAKNEEKVLFKELPSPPLIP